MVDAITREEREDLSNGLLPYRFRKTQENGGCMGTIVTMSNAYEAALTAAEAERDALKAENERLRDVFDEIERVFMSGCSDEEVQRLADLGNSFAPLVQKIRRARARAALTGDGNG